MANILGITTQTLRVYEDEGRIPFFRSEGGHRLVKREALLAFLGYKGIFVDDTLFIQECPAKNRKPKVIWIDKQCTLLRHRIT